MRIMERGMHGDGEGSHLDPQKQPGEGTYRKTGEKPRISRYEGVERCCILLFTNEKERERERGGEQKSTNESDKGTCQDVIQSPLWSPVIKAYIIMRPEPDLWASSPTTA